MFYDLFEDDVLADDCANVVPDLSCLLSDDELTEILPEGSPYRELVLNDGGDNRPELLLAVASMDVEELLVSAVVAAGARWEDGSEGEDTGRLERALVLFAASNMSKVREAVGRVRGLPGLAVAALADGSRHVRDNALSFVAMQADVSPDVLHTIAVLGNDFAKDLVARHAKTYDMTLEALAEYGGKVGDDARRELKKRSR
jgi:hypothetical protein